MTRQSNTNQHNIVFLYIHEELPVGPIESFDWLLASQVTWSRVCTIRPRPKKYNKMDTTINNLLAVYNKEGYILAVSDGSVKYMHQVSFG